MRRLSSTISQSYDLQQQELRVVFPQDELDEEREQSDLSPEDLEAREARRTELCDHANALKLLMIQGLRARNRDTLQIRGELLYYLAEAYEFASLIDVTVVEAWATQLDVNEIQARAGTMLKIQGQEAHISRAQIQQELLSVDRVWHNLLQAQMSGTLFELLTGLVPLGYYRRDRLPQ